MPSYKDNNQSCYVTKEIDDLMNGRNVLDVTLDLMMMIRGSADYNKEDVENCVKILEFYKKYWYKSKYSLYDDGVYNLITISLNNYYVSH